MSVQPVDDWSVGRFLWSLADDSEPQVVLSSGQVMNITMMHPGLRQSFVEAAGLYTTLCGEFQSQKAVIEGLQQQLHQIRASIACQN